MQNYTSLDNDRKPLDLESIDASQRYGQNKKVKMRLPSIDAVPRSSSLGADNSIGQNVMLSPKAQIRAYLLQKTSDRSQINVTD